jgi:hypothetical protein
MARKRKAYEAALLFQALMLSNGATYEPPAPGLIGRERSGVFYGRP